MSTALKVMVLTVGPKSTAEAKATKRKIAQRTRTVRAMAD